MPKRDVLHGSRSVAEAVKLCNVNVIAAYPITPQPPIVEDLAEMIANGELDAEYVMVESEHTAMSACIGAQATGARTFTATSSQGLALMHEMLFIASGMRMPIVMANANRALSAPINIWNDQQDSIAQRDAGWIQLYAETNQEALDTTIIAYKIAEDKRVQLPAMVCLDGFVLTHTIEPVEIPDKETVDSYIGYYKPTLYLDPEDPMTQGAFADPFHYMEFRLEQQKAMEAALEVIQSAHKEFAREFGRDYGNGLLEEYRMDDAEIVIVAMGSVVGTIKDVVDEAGDKNVGVLKLKTFRPLPREQLRKVLKDAKVVAVVEKDVSIGLGMGALASELRDTFYDMEERPKVISVVAGLGGRDITKAQIREVIEKSKEAVDGEAPEAIWVGLR
jgi:pyruvate ferredoxin oxidoreductase alpha subunit